MVQRLRVTNTPGPSTGTGPRGQKPRDPKNDPANYPMWNEVKAFHGNRRVETLTNPDNGMEAEVWQRHCDEGELHALCYVNPSIYPGIADEVDAETNLMIRIENIKNPDRYGVKVFAADGRLVEDVTFTEGLERATVEATARIANEGGRVERESRVHGQGLPFNADELVTRQEAIERLGQYGRQLVDSLPEDRKFRLAHDRVLFREKDIQDLEFNAGVYAAPRRTPLQDEDQSDLISRREAIERLGYGGSKFVARLPERFKVRIGNRVWFRVSELNDECERQGRPGLLGMEED